MISLWTMSSASSQLMRLYLLLPRFWVLRPPGPVEPGAPLRSKSTRLSGYITRLDE